MRFAFFIAKRYLIARKTSNFINIISWVSFSGVMVGTIALIIVLSVFNGLENLVGTLYNRFDPDLKVEVKKGKNFELNNAKILDIKALSEVLVLSKSLEENALFRYKNNENIATIKGVDTAFSKINKIDSNVYYGKYLLKSDSVNYCVLGNGVAGKLSIALNDYYAFLEIYVPKKGKITSLNPEQAFSRKRIQPIGIFDIQPELNQKYVLAPLDFVQDLLSVKNKISALEISLSPDANVSKIQEKIKNILGNNYTVKNRYEQQEAIYKIFRLEKWGAFLILSFIIFIAALNLVGSLTMLIIDKKHHIAMLSNMGANKTQIRLIFLLEGLLITFVGTVLGIIFGSLICLIQEKFGLIGLQTAGDFVVEAYPVALRLNDILLVFLTVLFLGLICSAYPAWQSAKQTEQKYSF